MQFGRMIQQRHSNLRMRTVPTDPDETGRKSAASEISLLRLVRLPVLHAAAKVLLIVYPNRRLFASLRKKTNLGAGNHTANREL